VGDIFLSYKKEDRARAAPLVAALEAEGLSVWWDQHIGVGADWRETLTRRLEAAKCVIVLWSRHSVDAGGRFVQDEASRADRRNVYLPVVIDPVELPLGFGQLQALSLIGWRGDRKAAEFLALLAAARAMVAGEARPTPVHMPPARQPRLGRRLLLGGGAAALLGAAGAAGVLFGPKSLRCGIGLCEPGQAPPSSIAVLPFRNLSGDPSQDYLSDGMSEELRDALARLGGITVAARTSSDAFRNARGDIARIAAKLGVAYVLDGSVRRSDQTLRVSAQLIDARTGVEKWAKSYDGGMKDVMIVQTTIASSVAQELKGRLLTAEAAAVARPPTAVPAAYDAYLRGRQLYDLSGDEKTYREALRLFDTAIAADPKYAGAYAGRAETLTALANQFEPADRLKATYDAAVVSARKAVALAPDSAPALSALGYTLAYGKLDFKGARGPYERSVQAGPNNTDVLIRYGLFACRTGAMEAGLAALNKAVALDPLNPRAYKALGQALYAARRYDESIPQLRHALELSPGMNSAHAAIGDNLYLQGKAAEARAEYVREPQALTRLTGLAIVEARLGRPAAAKAAYDQLVAMMGDSASYQRAQVLASWGDDAGALATLDTAARVGDNGLIYLRNDPLFDGLRSAPRLVALLARLAV
jgi:TolB-like protein/Tfp pilus assembly protein PilF